MELDSPGPSKGRRPGRRLLPQLPLQYGVMRQQTPSQMPVTPVRPETEQMAQSPTYGTSFSPMSTVCVRHYPQKFYPYFYLDSSDCEASDFEMFRRLNSPRRNRDDPDIDECTCHISDMLYPTRKEPEGKASARKKNVKSKPPYDPSMIAGPSTSTNIDPENIRCSDCYERFHSEFNDQNVEPLPGTSGANYADADIDYQRNMDYFVNKPGPSGVKIPPREPKDIPRRRKFRKKGKKKSTSVSQEKTPTETKADVEHEIEVYKRSGNKAAADFSNSNNFSDDSDTQVILRPKSQAQFIKKRTAYLVSKQKVDKKEESSLSSDPDEPKPGPSNVCKLAIQRDLDVKKKGKTLVSRATNVTSSDLCSSDYSESDDDSPKFRSFTITKKGILSWGAGLLGRDKLYDPINNRELTQSDFMNIPRYRVLVYGGSNVGKTSLISQFVADEDDEVDRKLKNYDRAERSVTILLDGKMMELSFIDHLHTDIHVENYLLAYQPDACIVVYSIACRTSFHIAEETLRYLWLHYYADRRLVVAVASKIDLVRSRVVKVSEGMRLAERNGSRFIEISGTIRHNIDDLLISVVTQIYLHDPINDANNQHPSRRSIYRMYRTLERIYRSFRLVKQTFNRLCGRDDRRRPRNLNTL